MALAGADCLIYPTAIGWDPNDTPAEQQRQLQAWQQVQLGHAIANQLPVVVANRVGWEADPSGRGSGTQFWGNSFIADAQGQMLAQSDTAPAALQASLCLQQTEQQRRLWPFLRERRVDAYDRLSQRVLRHD